MLVAEVRVRGGVVRVELDERGVLLVAPGWRQRLTRMQAVELAEALDAAGTRRADG